jgi:hypothetical protein
MTINKTSAFYRWTKFIVGLAIFWSFTYVICPAITATSEDFTTMAKFIDDSGIETGEFYYTDIEVCGEADLGARSTFEHMPRSMNVAVK